MDLLTANMPFLQNNFCHVLGNNWAVSHAENFQTDFIGSRVEVLLETQLFSTDYLPLNQREGYGLLRLIDESETPGSRDIVIYESVPNTLPRVGGIITSVIQTPLSHLNLRAIQDNIPNAYIKNVLENESITSLLNKYVYYSVRPWGPILREASLEEVEAWYEELRPNDNQIPDRNLSYIEIFAS